MTDFQYLAVTLILLVGAAVLIVAALHKIDREIG